MIKLLIKYNNPWNSTTVLTKNTRVSNLPPPPPKRKCVSH